MMMMIIFITQRYQVKGLEEGSDNRDNCKVSCDCAVHRLIISFHPSFISVLCCLILPFDPLFHLYPIPSRFEFKFGLRRLGHSKVIPVVMEEEMRDNALWKGILSSEVGSLLYVDMTSDHEIAFLGKYEEFYRRTAGGNKEVKLLVRRHCSCYLIQRYSVMSHLILLLKLRRLLLHLFLRFCLFRR
jgi:hypothetical protein